MRKIIVLSLLAFILSLSCYAFVFAAARQGNAPPARQESAIFQLSTWGSIFRGVYDGAITCGELKQRGNFGIGTFDSLDGEMVVVDGEIFQVKGDGNVLAADDKLLTPFATVTFFAPDQKFSQEDIASLEELQQNLEPFFPSRNIFYAIRIDGTFNYVKTRSVPRQERPYRPVVQSEFEARDITGTIIGFWCPGYAQGILAPGFHFHFISADRKMGGHLLDCRFAKGDVQIQYHAKLETVLPATEAFRKADLSRR